MMYDLSIGMNATDLDYNSSNYNRFTAPWTLSGTTRVSWHQKGKPNLDLLEQEIVCGSGISQAICKSAPCPRQVAMPASHHSVFTGQMPFLLSNQQHQSTEGQLTLSEFEGHFCCYK